MFPLKYCGTWYLLYSTNPSIPPSTILNIQYNRLNITPIQDYNYFQIKRTHQGVISIHEDCAKVVWSQKVNYEIDSLLLPAFPIYGQDLKCPPLYIKYSMDETNSVCTFTNDKYTYVFHKSNQNEKKDNILKLFITQLLLDLIIRHL